MTAKVRQTNITRFLEASLLRQAEGKLKNPSVGCEPWGSLSLCLTIMIVFTEFPRVVGPLHTYKKHVKCHDQDKLVGVRKTELDTLFGLWFQAVMRAPNYENKQFLLTKFSNHVT